MLLGRLLALSVLRNRRPTEQTQRIISFWLIAWTGWLAQLLEATESLFRLSRTRASHSLDVDGYLFALFQRKVLHLSLLESLLFRISAFLISVIFFVLVECTDEIEGVVPFGKLHANISLLPSLRVD